MRALFLLNPQSGRFDDRDVLVRDVQALCQGLDIAADVICCSNQSLAAQARAAADRQPPYDVIVAGGGDGTIGTVAGEVCRTGIPLGILPLGTFNHFAKDLGLPIRLEPAIALLARGLTRRIDIGRVNGRVFVNNASIGLYPRLIDDRNQQRQQAGRRKWLAFAIALARALLEFRLLALELVVGVEIIRLRTPLLFIGNNQYRLGGPALFRRTTLDAGRLDVQVVKRRSWTGLVGLVLRLLLGRQDPGDIEAFSAERIQVHSRRTLLRVALDGETHRIAGPLRFELVPHGLTVCVAEG